MADSSHLKKVVEPFVVNRLSERRGVRLSPQQIMVGPREDGLLPPSKIEMLVCDCLPEEMRMRVSQFQARAKEEVGDKGTLWKIGGKRR
jgi:hypothetical protein